MEHSFQGRSSYTCAIGLCLGQPKLAPSILSVGMSSLTWRRRSMCCIICRIGPLAHRWKNTAFVAFYLYSIYIYIFLWIWTQVHWCLWDNAHNSVKICNAVMQKINHFMPECSHFFLHLHMYMEVYMSEYCEKLSARGGWRNIYIY